MQNSDSDQKCRWLETLGLHRKELRAWALYDWANSGFATIVLAFVLPAYYAGVAGAELEPQQRTAYWGYTTGLALLIVALIAPILGATADHLGSRKKFLAAFAFLGASGSAALALVHQGDWFLASVLFVFANVGFAGANVFYNALLPFITKSNEIDRVSTAGYAIGYIGGGLLFAIDLVLIVKWEWFGFSDSPQAVRFSFVTVAVWWVLFSIPMFRHVREPAPGKAQNQNGNEKENENGSPAVNIWTVGFTRLFHTFQELKNYRQVWIFLIGYWFYSDGVGTIIKMATIYGSEIGIGQEHLMGAGLLVQFLGVPCTFAFGALAAKLGTKPGLMITLIVYTLICILGYFMNSPWHFWMLACMVALVQGGCQALSRSLYASMIPQKKSSEFFSFISVSDRFAGIFGPMIFAVVSQMLGASRFSILFLVVFFIIGMVFLAKVDIEAGRRAAGND